MSIDRHRATNLLDAITERIKPIILGMVARKLGHAYDMGYADCRTEFKNVIDLAWRLLDTRNPSDMDETALALRKLLQKGRW